MARERLYDIDRAKGLAISLVVLGHLIADEYPPHNDWYFHVERIIYSFHMAFFMFITGVVMFYTYPEIHTVRDYGAYVKKKFVRLIPAYVLTALVIAAGKAAAARLAHIENPVHGLSDLAEAFLRPTDSYCTSVWYVYTVFIFFLTIPVLLKLVRGRLEILLAFALVLYFLPRTAYFAEKAVAQHLFVFLLGGLAVRHYPDYLRVLDRYRAVFLVLFAGCVVLYSVTQVPKLLFGLCSIPALHSLVRLSIFDRDKLLSLFGQYAFPIYLMNTIAIGVVRVLVQKYWSWDGANFLLVAPLLFAAGLVMPIVFHRLFIKNTPVLKVVVQA